MAPAHPILINAQPLRTNPVKESANSALEREEKEYEASCYSSSSGIVISHRDGTGEVLVGESFEDTGLHFIFSNATNIQYPSSFDPIGVGSVVQIYWTRSFERVVRTAHIVIQIEKMEVYKCATLLRERIFVTFNSHLAPGVAMGVNERNTCVAFHPNCCSEISRATLQAHLDKRTEFEMKPKHRENTNRMVEVYLVCAPFRIEIAGNVEKVPYLVLRRIQQTRGKEGVAVIMKIIKNHFMEASFLQSSERVYFDSKACHSNILEKVCVGSLINVHATPAFLSSMYRWYGYDVTLCKNYLADANTQRSFKIKRNEILQNYRDGEEDDQPMKHAKEAFSSKPSKEVKNSEEEKAKKKRPQNLFKFNSHRAQYKLRRLLLDQNYCLMNALEAKNLVDAYFLDRIVWSDEKENRYMSRMLEDDEGFQRNLDEEEENESMRTTRPIYSESLEDEIRGVLEPFNLNQHRKPTHQIQYHNPLSWFARAQQAVNDEALAKTARKKGNPLPPPLSEEEIRTRLGSLMDEEGFAVNQKVEKAFVLPDTLWKPTERRWIGVHDDLQWVMMATFLPPPPENSTEKTLLGGWWYRRSVPRESPVLIVKEMETRRNVIKDCTENLEIG